MRLQTPPEEGEVVSLAHDGRGVVRASGKTVFVPGALPGERVVFCRLRKRRSYDEAMLVEVLVRAPERVEPACPHFGTCGGCALQHLDATAQVEFKRAHLAEELARIGKVEPAEWLPPLTASPWAYRRRARLGARYVPKKGKALVGFRERASPYIAEIERCHVLADPVGPLVGALGTLIGGLSIRERVPQIEVAIADETVALVFRVLDAPAAADVASLTAFGVAHGIDIWLQPGGYETVAALTPPVRPLTYSLPDFDVTLQFEPCDFVQVNAPLNRLMVARAVSLLDPQPADSVLDLYCGLGNFSLPLARRAASVVGVEGDASLVARARANAERNGLGNVSFHVANLASDLRGSPWLERGYDLVLLDPPRAGAAEVLPAVVAARPRRIVYVSCHPGTLARDAGVLVHEHGYRLTAAGAMDMFPHTAHVESIAVFEPGGWR